MILRRLIIGSPIVWFVVSACLGAQPARLAETYKKAVQKVNEDHARKPGKTREEELPKRLPKKARSALDRLVRIQSGKDLSGALLTAGEAALDLASLEDFEAVRKRLEAVSPEDARRLGTALARPRFLLRGLGGLDRKYLEHIAGILDAILDAYDRVFGFEEWSKVPGKKIRVRIQLVQRIERPPYFDPSPRYHSEISFPVIDARELRSPTKDGKFQFYGLCHELGHLIAMWGDRNTMEDHHAWAHFTGVVIVESLSRTKKKYPFLKKLKDVRWRSLKVERKSQKDVRPSLENQEAVLALLIRLHDVVGTKALGKALNLMDRKRMGHRINQVRYYGFKDLEKALLKVVKSKKACARVKKLIP